MLGALPEAPRDAAPAGLAGPPRRIGVIGTSLSHAEDWTADLAARIGTCTGTSPEMIVMAMPGALSVWGAGRAPDMAGRAPDVVLVELDTNDADLRRGISAAEGLAAHVAVLDALEGIPVVMLRMNPASGLRGWLRPGLGARREAVAALARERGAGTLDLESRWRTRWQGRAAPMRGDMPDGLHPRAAVASGLIAPAAASLLVPGCGPPEGGS